MPASLGKDADMTRKRSQPTFIDAALVELGSARMLRFFKRVDQFVDWKVLARLIGDIFKDDSLVPGQPHESLVFVVKSVMLARWYDLSDGELEEFCNDRIAVRRWLGLFDDEKSPDASTFCNWRKRLRERGHEHTIFDAVARLLEKHELIVDKGTIVDATILPAPRPRKVKDQTTGEKVKRAYDPEASYTVQGGIHFGYRGYLATDTNGLVRDVTLDTASVHESQHIDELIKGETKAVFADSAYYKEDRCRKLKKKKIRDGILRKPMRDHPLTKQEKAHNRAIRPIRAVIEHAIAWIKKTGYRAVRYKGIVRNQFDWRLRAAAYNLARALSLAGI
jgi:IS5 family transposase